MTISDVAAAAGVSKMTVSNVLSADQARRRHASEETRARVMEAARRLRYRPNSHALALRKKLTNIVGFYSGYGYLNPENAFLAAIFGGLQEGCDAHRKDLLVHGIYRGASVADIYAELVDGRIDGLVLFSPVDDPLVEMLADSYLPVVAVVDLLPAFPSIIVDDALGSQLLATHLAAKGYEIAIYHVPARKVESAERRYCSFVAAAERLGLSIETRTVRGQAPGADVSESDLEWLAARGQNARMAAVCWNDPVAYDVLAYCDRIGVRVPEDLGVAGFDGVISPRTTGRQVTTIRAHWPRVGMSAISTLTALVDGDSPPHETIVPVALVEGNTT